MEMPSFVVLCRLFYLSWEKMLEIINPDKAYVFFDKYIYLYLDHGINTIHCPQENACTHEEPH